MVDVGAAGGDALLAVIRAGEHTVLALVVLQTERGLVTLHHLHPLNNE